MKHVMSTCMSKRGNWTMSIPVQVRVLGYENGYRYRSCRTDTGKNTGTVGPVQALQLWSWILQILFYITFYFAVLNDIMIKHKCGVMKFHSTCSACGSCPGIHAHALVTSCSGNTSGIVITRATITMIPVGISTFNWKDKKVHQLLTAPCEIIQ